MLGRLAWLEGVERRTKLFYDGGSFARVHVFSKRLTLQRARQADEADSGGMIAFAWFVWEHGYVGRPTLGWL